ncbi:MAG: MarR family winged helix-turn-helix transcriptional regulator [Desulfovibrionales bacterium]
MPFSEQERSRELLSNLRRIMQAIDLHSKQLSKRFGVTGPQLVILQELSLHQSLSVSDLSRSVSLSQGTVTDIVTRLEKKKLLQRERSSIDKRKVLVSLTETARKILDQAPSPLQDRFLHSFSQLEEWEQLMILRSISRVVTLMSAEELEVQPVLAAGPLHADSEP